MFFILFNNGQRRKKFNYKKDKLVCLSSLVFELLLIKIQKQKKMMCVKWY